MGNANVRGSNAKSSGKTATAGIGTDDPTAFGSAAGYPLEIDVDLPLDPQVRPHPSCQDPLDQPPH